MVIDFPEDKEKQEPKISETDFNKKLLLDLNFIRANLFQHPVRHTASSLDLLIIEVQNRIEENK